MQWIPLAFTFASAALFGLLFLNIIDGSFLGFWLLLGLLFTGKYVKKTNILSSKSDKVKNTFKQYALLLDQIENEQFTSQLLQIKQQQIQSEHKKASVIFSQFSKSLDALDNRNNLIAAIFGNGFLLSDIKNSYRVEQWIAQ